MLNSSLYTYSLCSYPSPLSSSASLHSLQVAFLQQCTLLESQHAYFALAFPPPGSAPPSTSECCPLPTSAPPSRTPSSAPIPVPPLRILAPPPSPPASPAVTPAKPLPLLACPSPRKPGGRILDLPSDVHSTPAVPAPPLLASPRPEPFPPCFADAGAPEAVFRRSGLLVPPSPPQTARSTSSVRSASSARAAASAGAAMTTRATLARDIAGPGAPPPRPPSPPVRTAREAATEFSDWLVGGIQGMTPARQAAPPPQQPP